MLRWHDDPAASLADDLRVRLVLAEKAGTAEEENLTGGGGSTAGEEEITEEALTELEKAAAGEEGDDEQGDYKKRFADTRTALNEAHTKNKDLEGRLLQIEEQNRLLAARLPKEEKIEEQEQPDAFAVDEVALSMKIADLVDQDMRKLDFAKDPDAYKKTFQAVAREIIKAIPGIVKPGVEKIATERATQLTDQQRRAQGAYAAARQALTDEGLDPDLTYDYMVVERNRVMASDPTWATRTPVDSQFKDLAKRTKEHLSKVVTKEEREAIEEENAEHRRTAGAIMGRGASPKKPAARAAERGEDEEEGGSMVEAINANKKAAIVRGNRAARMVRGV